MARMSIVCTPKFDDQPQPRQTPSRAIPKWATSFKGCLTTTRKFWIAFAPAPLLKKSRDAGLKFRKEQMQMKILMFFILCLTSAVLAEDFKTVSGKEYKDATITRVEPDGIALKYKSGVSKIYFTELPKEVQQGFHYDPVKAAEFNAAVQATQAQFNAKVQQEEAVAKEKAQAARVQQAAALREEQAQREAEALKESRRPRPRVSYMQSIGGG